ncbi:lateral tail fiber protein [Escherichia phage KarlBarth]|uniref:Lateral tail fiber protein n=1 Tax=Escherichia phage KarlBarth TaxID=2851981 RepID=A0AAE7VW65_9CAUD|nr:lateral tail fiber protein [Escherichia phage KarlBarth]QXV81944.1 lateral tail fiber protein [Escherichia phage KarlBarth]
MAAGTLSVTNNSKAVVGVGTTFTAFKAGDFLTLVVGQVPYTVAIASVESNTALTLVLPFDGPTATGLAWDGVARDTMSLATMGVTVQAQKALRLMIADENNWRAIFGDAEEITVTLPNGQVMQGMSWGYLSSLLKDVDPVELQNIANQAVTAKNDAVSAKNDAQTAKTAAETARTQAQSAKTAAESARDDAQTAKTAAETARTQAQTAKTAAETAKGAAEDARDEAKQYAEQAGAPYKQVLQPLPDVWIPFNDSLDMLAGFAPGYKTVTVADDEVTMPSDKVVSLKRASTATYINKSGEFKIAEIDEPRFEKYGLLIEGQRTNHIINGGAPAGWGHSTSVGVVTGTDAFGFLYGKFGIGQGDVGSTTVLNLASVTSANSLDTSGVDKYVTASCRFRSDKDVRLRVRFAEGADQGSMAFSGDAYIKLSDLSVSKTGVAADRITVEVEKDEATGWNRAVVMLQATTALVNAQIQISPVSSYAAGDYIELATPQVELGIGASSYIISGTSPTTRASDMVTVPANRNLYNLPFTVLVEVHKNWSKAPNAAPRVFDTGGHQSGAAIILGFGSGDIDGYPYCDIGGAHRRLNENAGLKHMVMGMRVKENQDTCAVSNGILSTESKTTWTYLKGSATLRIGGQTTTGDRHLFGHVRNFRIWHNALTDLQMGELV